MMLNLTPILIALALLLVSQAAPAAAADRDRPVREVKSENGAFVLRVEPGRPGKAPCTATLHRRDGADRGPVWERPLVNAIGPSRASVRDDGAFVVTLDEVRFGGARNAVVVYGKDGALLRHWLLPDLLHGADWQHARVRRDRIDWLDGAEFEFADPDRFVIRLNWEREIVIDLQRLSVVSDGATGAESGLPPDVAAVLYGDAGAEQDEFLAPPTPEEAQLLAQEWYAEIAPEYADRPLYVGPPEVAELGLPIPLPDPAHPIDYVKWQNDVRSGADSPGVEMLQNAIDLAVPLPDDEAVHNLFNRALEGDDAALQDPLLTDFLDQNAVALEYFREFGRHEYHGMPMESPDGSMLGVLLPHLGQFRNLAKIGALSARQQALAGNSEEAAALTLDLVNAGARMTYGPTLIEKLVGTAIRSLGEGVVMDLPTDPSARIDFAGLADRLEADVVPPEPIAHSFQFERAFYLDTVQRTFNYDQQSGRYIPNLSMLSQFLSVAGDESASIFSNPLQTLRFATMDFHQTLRAGNELYDEYVAAAQLPFQEGRARFGEVEQSIEDPLANPMVKVLMPALGRTRYVESRAASRHDAAVLYARIRAYEQQYGAPPDSLDQVAPSGGPVDPLSGLPFRYERTGDGFRLYSLGVNQIDDGGVEGRSDDGDVVFWPRPE